MLKTKHAYRWVHPVISRHATVKEAIGAAIEGGLSAMMVLHDRKVVGLLTSRDLLRILASGIKENEAHDDILMQAVGDHMLPISQVIYARPEETIGMCRTLMAKLGIKALPILSREGVVEGLITARDMSDYGLSAKDKGGKKSYLDDISERVGLSSNTSMAEPPAYMKAQLALETFPLYTNVGVALLPHPFKKADGLGRGMNGRHLHSVCFVFIVVGHNDLTLLAIVPSMKPRCHRHRHGRSRPVGRRSLCDDR